MNPNVRVCDRLASMCATPLKFKNLTNFTIDGFDDLCIDVCLIIVGHAKTTSEESAPARHPYKLYREKQLLAFLLFMKHENTFMFEVFEWIWSKSVGNDDVVFIASYINYSPAHEIGWPNAYERQRLGQMFSGLVGVIGNVDNTLVRIRRLCKDPNHNWIGNEVF